MFQLISEIGGNPLLVSSGLTVSNCNSKIERFYGYFYDGYLSLDCFSGGGGGGGGVEGTSGKVNRKDRKHKHTWY